MRELRVEDALLYLDQVKVEFGDRPHIYNEFLDIMKTFKTQQIDTPGVIRRVSTLFQGNRKLVLGFNTFLPEGYKIEIPEDGIGPPVAVYRAPGSNAAHVLRESPESQAVSLVGLSSSGIPPRGMGHPGPEFVTTNRGTPKPGPPGLPQDVKPVAARGGPTAPFAAKAPPNNNNGVGMPQQDPARGPMVHMLPSDAGGVGPRPPRPPVEAVSGARQAHQQQLPGGVAPRSDQLTQPQQQKPPPPSQQQQQRFVRPPESKMPGMGRGQRPAIPPGPSPKRPLEMPPKATGFEQQASSLQRPPLQPLPQQHAPPPPQAQQQLGKQQPQQPLEFDHAINYVTTIKRRFASEPETYKKFLEILHTYQKDQRGIKEVLDDVSALFEDHPDLLKEFTYFLPDAVQAQAKAQLDQVAKEAEARKQKKAKEAIMNTAQTMQQHVKTLQEQARPRADYERVIGSPGPFGTQGRSVDRETSIIRRAQYGKVSFDPMRPPRKNSLTPSQMATKFGRPTSIPDLPKVPNTAETAFFQRAKEHINRKELAADKPAGSRRHTPWTEFLKCLHLFGAGILNKDELMLLLKSLFMQGHAPKSGANASGGNSNPIVAHDANELLRDFEEIIIGRGPYAHQQNSIKDKSKYGTLRERDFEFGNCEHPTSSYWSYPGDYPKSLFLTHHGQTDDTVKVLNNKYLCVDPLTDLDGNPRYPRSIELSDGSRKRHNVYEEAMFRIEDERYELDMAVERNMHALRRIEPFAEEVQSLREQEEKDGQPIGRLRYKLDRYAFNSIHINAVGRIYGDRGDEVLQHLQRNPLITLPVVYQRLKQKDMEWRKAKTELSERWNHLQEANYEGSLDVQCYFNRRELELTFSSSLLKDQCKRVRSYIKHPEKLRLHKATRRFKPSFGNRIPDFGAVLHQPFVATEYQAHGTDKFAIDLITNKLKSVPNLSQLNQERIGRVFAEFMVPWFEYPTYWVTKEVRESFGGKLTPAMVKYVPGQRVKTIIGDGNILSFMPATSYAAPRYRIKTAFGIALLNPSAVFYAIPSKDSPFVRRDGVMVRDESALNDEDSLDADKLDKKYKILFCTESIYLFLRLYTLLCSILSDTQTQIESSGPSKDPSMLYHNPQRKGSEHLFSLRLDLASVCLALKKVTRKEMSFRDYVSFGRKVCRDKSHQIAVLPKLVENCCDYLVRLAKEDAVLNLYDYCHYSEVDPVAVRAQCLAVVPDAIYRVQYDTDSNSIMYCYLPETEPLLANPRGEYDDIEDEMNVEVTDGPIDEDDPMEEEEVDHLPPVSKRIRLK